MRLLFIAILLCAACIAFGQAADSSTMAYPPTKQVTTLRMDFMKGSDAPKVFKPKAAFGMGLVAGFGSYTFTHDNPIAASGAVTFSGLGLGITYASHTLYNATQGEDLTQFSFGAKFSANVFAGLSGFDNYKHGRMGILQRGGNYLSAGNRIEGSTSFSTFGALSFNLGFRTRLNPDLTWGLNVGPGLCVNHTRLFFRERAAPLPPPSSAIDAKDLEFEWMTFGYGVMINSEAYLNFKTRNFLSLSYDLTTTGASLQRMDAVRLQLGRVF